jgi:hypothetical protein
VVVVVVGRQSLGEQASSWLRRNTVFTLRNHLSISLSRLGIKTRCKRPALMKVTFRGESTIVKDTSFTVRLCQYTEHLSSTCKTMRQDVARR